MPTISVVVPSYNHGEFLAECLESILSQEEVEVEVLVCDGGSQDASRRIITSFGKRIAFWRSHSDKGQADALNEGFHRSKGDVLMWLNSDDVLEKGALRRIAQAFVPGLTIYAGEVMDFNKCGPVRVVKQTALSNRTVLMPWRGNEWHMPGIAFNRAVWREFGPLDVSYRYLFDAKMIGNAIAKSEVIILNQLIARFRLHGGSKTVSEKCGFYIEGRRLFREAEDIMTTKDRMRGIWYHGVRSSYGWLKWLMNRSKRNNRKHTL